MIMIAFCHEKVTKNGSDPFNLEQGLAFVAQFAKSFHFFEYPFAIIHHEDHDLLLISDSGDIDMLATGVVDHIVDHFRKAAKKGADPFNLKLFIYDDYVKGIDDN